MDTNRLKQFRTVVETGNLRRAAELLRISHSGLSKSLKVFEREVGARLLLPHGRGIMVTDDGQRIYHKSEALLREVDALLQDSETRARETRPVRIGSFEVFTSYFVGELIRDYLPGTALEIHELVPGKLEEALLLDRIDAGVTYEPIPRRGIEYSPVARLEMAAYALAGRFRDVEPERIPFVVPADPLEGAPSGVRGLDGWPDGAFRRDVRYRVDLMTTGLELARTGACAIFIPKFIARLYNRHARPEFALERLRAGRAVPEVARDVFVVKRESTAESRELRQIAKALRKACERNPA